MSTRVAPVFPVSDLDAALAYYRGLGFGTRPWRGGGYGFVTFDGAEIHLGAEPDLETRADRRATAYLFVEDAGALARAWLAAGAMGASRRTPDGVSTRACSSIPTAT
jgi:hypothetical protein